MMLSVVPGKFQTSMIDTTLQPELSFRPPNLFSCCPLPMITFIQKDTIFRILKTIC